MYAPSFEGILVSVYCWIFFSADGFDTNALICQTSFTENKSAKCLHQSTIYCPVFTLFKMTRAQVHASDVCIFWGLMTFRLNPSRNWHFSLDDLFALFRRRRAHLLHHGRSAEELHGRTQAETSQQVHGGRPHQSRPTDGAALQLPEQGPSLWRQNRKGKTGEFRGKMSQNVQKCVKHSQSARCF